MIDHHNWIQQDDHCIERKFVTREWHHRVNMMLFGMCVVDAHLLHKECTGCDEPPNTFFWKLAAEIIDQTTTRSRQVPSQLTKTTPAGLKRPPEDESPPSGIGLHVTPPKSLNQRRQKDQPTMVFQLSNRESARFNNVALCVGSMSVGHAPTVVTWTESHCMSTTHSTNRNVGGPTK